MKQIIKRVLEEISTSQVNLSSASARDMLSDEIESALNVSGEYKKYTKYELDEQEARKTWVCGICGKNTFEVEDDYIGSGTNHLGCELELEMKDNKRVTKDRRQGDRREKNYSQKKHEDKVFGHDQGGSYEKMESLKLVEEISSGSIDLGYIFESPDGGTTVYKRQVGESERELVTKEQWKEYNRNR